MNIIRRGAAVAQRYLVSLYFLGVVTQFFLVGMGLFGMKAGDTIGKAHSLNAHRDFGWGLETFPEQCALDDQYQCLVSHEAAAHILTLGPLRAA